MYTSYILVTYVCTLVKGKISEENTADTEIIFKNCSPFTDYISKINNTQIDDAKNI